MLNFPQNQRFSQAVLKKGGREGSTLTNGEGEEKRFSGGGEADGAKANLPPSKGGREIFELNRLLGLDGAHGAGALAGAAVDAGAGIDFHVVAAHRDRAHGAGALASAAGDARVSDLTSHVLHLQQMMCFEPSPIVPHSAENASLNFDEGKCIISAKISHPCQENCDHRNTMGEIAWNG